MENNKKYTELLWNGKYSESWLKDFFELRKKATINIERPNLAFQIVETDKGEFYFVETKGLVDIDVPRKDERAKKWCEDLTKLTGKKWNFIRVDQSLFESHDFKTFDELVKAHKKN